MVFEDSMETYHSSGEGTHYHRKVHQATHGNRGGTSEHRHTLYSGSSRNRTEDSNDGGVAGEWGVPL